MADAPEDFAALLDRARGGDQAALTRLVELYEPKVRLVARLRLGPALRPYLDSMDLVQSVHRSLLRGLKGQKFAPAGPEQLLALAVTLVRRKAARHWRRVQRQRRLEAAPGEAGPLAELLTSLSDPRPDPAQAAQFNDQVAQLCQHLNSTERRMLELRLQGYRTDEIARELGLHPVALRVRMSRLQAGGVLTDWL
jgi:RNA polymerase sigma-70 factor (ECF subfamily)